MRTLLCVDDNPTVRELMDIALGMKYKLLLCENGKEALDVVRNYPVDLILLDMVMPVMTGLEFYAELRKDSTVSDIPVIFLTGVVGREEVDDSVWKIITEAQGFISKPVEMNSLIDIIEEIFEKENAV